MSIRAVLPDLSEEGSGESESGTVTDSISVLLKNFGEMNKLWVRMQHMGHTRDSAQRTAERKEVRNLVGTNLVRISQLEGLTQDCDFRL